MTRRQANAIIGLLAVLVLALVIAPIFRTVVLHPVEGFIRDQQERAHCQEVLAAPPTPTPTPPSALGPDPNGYVPGSVVFGNEVPYCQGLLHVSPPPTPTATEHPPFVPGVYLGGGGGGDFFQKEAAWNYAACLAWWADDPPAQGKECAAYSPGPSLSPQDYQMLWGLLPSPSPSPPPASKAPIIWAPPSLPPFVP